MRSDTKNLLAPACLAADRDQEASAATRDRSEWKPTRLTWFARARTLLAIDRARQVLLRHAEKTDEPDPRAVEAADWLDMATTALTAPPAGGEPGGGA